MSGVQLLLEINLNLRYFSTTILCQHYNLKNVIYTCQVSFVKCNEVINKICNYLWESGVNWTLRGTAEGGKCGQAAVRHEARGELRWTPDSLAPSADGTSMSALFSSKSAILRFKFIVEGHRPRPIYFIIEDVAVSQ